MSANPIAATIFFLVMSVLTVPADAQVPTPPPAPAPPSANTDVLREAAWKKVWEVYHAYSKIRDSSQEQLPELENLLWKYLQVEENHDASSLVVWTKYVPSLVELFNEVHHQLQTLPSSEVLRNEVNALNQKPWPLPGETQESPAFQERLRKNKAAFEEAWARRTFHGELQNFEWHFIKDRFIDSFFSKDADGITAENLPLHRQFAEKLEDKELRELLLKRVAEWELLFPPPKKKSGKK